MTDPERDPVREHLRHILFGLLGTAEYRYRPRGSSGWREKLPWPGPSGPRELVFAQIEQALYRNADPGVIWILPEGWHRRQRYELTWPEAAGLFAAVEPALPPPPTQVTIDSTGRLAVEPLEDPPPKASKRCAEHVLQLLGEEQRRMTTAALVDALSARHLEWSTRVIESTCAWLVRQRVLDNKRDERGKGYGLINWDREGS